MLSIVLWQDNVKLLLNVAVEQADNELLLQKHFTALLSSVWKMKSRTPNRQGLLSSPNGLYFCGRIFSSSQTSQNSVKESHGKMKFTSMGPSSKLLSKALHESSSGRPDDVRSYNIESSPEQLDITLEFPGEIDASWTPFPRLINLSIHGAGHEEFIDKDCREEDNRLRDSLDVAERRYRYGTTVKFSCLSVMHLIFKLVMNLALL